MYDYRSAIKHIIENTKNEQHDLQNSAYAISTICNIILSEEIQMPKLTIDKPEITSDDQNEAPIVDKDTANTQPTENKKIAYSKAFCQKIQKIFSINNDLPTYQILSALRIGNATGNKILKAKNNIYLKRVNSFSINRTQKLKEKIAKEVNLPDEVILNDNIELNDSEAKHALDNNPTLNKIRAGKKASSGKKVSISEPITDFANTKLKQYANFGAMTKAIRQQHKMTQAKFAKYLSISASSLSQLEHNKISPSIAVVLNLAQLLNVSIADLKSHVGHSKATTKTKFNLYHNTSDKELIAKTLTKPLALNTYFARREFNTIKLLNNKGEAVYVNTKLNSQTEKIETGDLVYANIVNKHQAHILKIESRHMGLDNYITIHDAPVTNRDSHWVTFGNETQKIKDLNPDREYYSISDTFAVNQHINHQSTIDIAWRKQEPWYIVITKIQQNTPKTASSY